MQPESVQLESVSSLPCPANAQVYSHETTPGIFIRVASFPYVPNAYIPPNSAAETPHNRGTVVLFLGYTEFIEKYYAVVQQLNERNFSVLIADWRGQGGSTRLLQEREKAYVQAFTDCIADAESVLDTFLPAQENTSPRILIGHSMGGMLATAMLQKRPDYFNHAILTAPMHGLSPNTEFFMRYLAPLACKLGFGTSWLGDGKQDLQRDRSDLSSDKNKVQQWLAYWEQHPYLRLGAPTFQWAAAAAKFLATMRNPQAVARIKTPTLLCTCQSDVIVYNKWQDKVAAMNPCITQKVFQEAQHEILFEKDSLQTEFWQEFDKFIA